MKESEILQIQMMSKFFDRLCNLSDSELMTRKQMEVEMQHNLKAVNSELNRRNKEL